MWKRDSDLRVKSGWLRITSLTQQIQNKADNDHEDNENDDVQNHVRPEDFMGEVTCARLPITFPYFGAGPVFGVRLFNDAVYSNRPSAADDHEFVVSQCGVVAGAIIEI